MYKILSLNLLFFFLILSANSEIVKNINVQGNQRISDETIKVYGQIELNKEFDEEKINNILKNLYSTDFFENIEVSIINQTLNINLKEYPLINSIDLQGEKSNTVKKSILEKLSLKSKNSRSEERRVGKECRSRWSPYH